MNLIYNVIHNHGLRCQRILTSAQRLYHGSLLSSRENDLQLARKLYDGVEPTIGLEVHAQLNINAKLFSQGGNSNDVPSNSQLDLFDISLPGTLPKLNEGALRAAILSSFGLKSEVQDVIYFDRKNYFYTDMPAGYQITQYNKPIARDGYIDFIVNTYHKSVIAHSENYDLVRHVFMEERKNHEEFEPYIKRSRIKQIQLEQDSAKTLHQTNNDFEQELFSLIDYNRSGAALIEVVFEPDLCNHHEASSVIKKLILIMKTLGTCDCELQEGSLRVDANVSIRSISGREVSSSSRVELKNLNSLKALNKGIKYEIQRQAHLIRDGRKVLQETRTYDTYADQTVPLRIKEEAVDYRYVPEPSIPPIKLDAELIDEVKRNLPKTLPYNNESSLILQYNLPLILTSEILEVPGLFEYFEAIMRDRERYDAQIVGDFLVYVIHNLKRIPDGTIRVELKTGSRFIERLNRERMQSIIDMVADKKIGFTLAYDLIKFIYMSGDKRDTSKILRDLEWHYINDIDKIDELCAVCTKSLQRVSKKYAKKRDKKQLFVLLQKMCELTDSKIDVELAVERLNQMHEPCKSTAE